MTASPPPKHVPLARWKNYLAARTARGLVTRPRNTTFDVVCLFVLYTCAQGAATALLLRLFPA